MRLTCPNCGAQYEVPDEVIPESGRDVQCSNCGDTWFQHHPDHAPEIDEAETDEADWDAAPEPEPEPDDEEHASQPVASEDTDPERPADVQAEIEPPRRNLDPAVADVLREEAARERAARNAEAQSGLETQPDLGLEPADRDVDKRQAEAQARMARLLGQEEDQPEKAQPDPGTRRNLLPDIDEINSSLNSDTPGPGTVHPGDTDDMDASPPRGGFRRGFLTMVLLAVIGLLLYMFAPQLAQSVPALEGVLSGYVAFVDGLRGWLDQTVGGMAGGGS